MADYTVIRGIVNGVETMQEWITNLHMHTWYSDGHASHADLAEIAMDAGLDAILVTDHNIWVNGPEGYYHKDGRRVLLLVGEEVHDAKRQPQKNHLLVFGAGRELSTYAPDPQILINAARDAGGICFIAHPVDPALPAFHEPDISWIEWGVQGYNGIELWNGFSEMKTRVKTKLQGLYYAFNPDALPEGPLPETLKIWDDLLAAGKKIAAVGGSDAHALPMRLGPIRRTVFSYSYHFHAVNTHVLVPADPTGDATADRRMLLDAMGRGSAFVANDLHTPSRGFRFTAHGQGSPVSMGDEIPGRDGITLQVHLPQPAECRLLCDGRIIREWTGRDNIALNTSQPGIYRVEVYHQAAGKRRGWIFSNPIYVRG